MAPATEHSRGAVDPGRKTLMCVPKHPEIMASVPDFRNIALDMSLILAQQDLEEGSNKGICHIDGGRREMRMCDSQGKMPLPCTLYCVKQWKIVFPGTPKGSDGCEKSCSHVCE